MELVDIYPVPRITSPLKQEGSNANALVADVDRIATDSVLTFVHDYLSSAEFQLFFQVHPFDEENIQGRNISERYGITVMHIWVLFA
ncbi:hypothetical protein O9929_24510 [Vibrio lentus]|nr:hypothetical protein [Vibrio lentus]